MPTERKLRDYLAEHLELIEHGLQLIETEFELPNRAGARGFIDIFAWDRWRQLVVIELKVSDASARTALHELHKYVALLRKLHGLPVHKLRCLILSTNWHELHVPFSDFARSVSYPVEGRIVHLDPQGIPIRLEPITPLPEAEELHTSPHAGFFFYENQEGKIRDERIQEICLCAKELGIEDYCLLSLDKPQNFEKAATYSIYAAIGRLSPEIALKLEGQEGFSIEDYRTDDPEEGEDEWCHEQAALALIIERVQCDQFEIGYPDKLGSAINDHGWELSGICRSGRYSNTAILPDAALLKQLIGFEGASSQWYSCLTSPRFAASWQNALDCARRCLLGNDSWLTAFNWFMARAKQESPDSSVSAHIFNPLNIEMILWRFPIEGNIRMFPGLEIARESAGNRPPLVLLGDIQWDGITFPKDPEAILREAFEIVFEMKFTIHQFLIAFAMKDTWRLDAPLMAAHGLHYTITELEFTDPTTPTICRYIADDEGIRVNDRPLRTLQDFFEMNQVYLDALDRYMSQHCSIMSV